MSKSLIVVLLAVCACAYDVPPVTVSMLNGGGLSFALPDESGIALVAYHYSVNEDVVDATAGDFNFDVNEATGGCWRHENPLVNVSVGDVVHYWVHVDIHGAGYDNWNQNWAVDNSTDLLCNGTTAFTPSTTPHPRSAGTTRTITESTATTTPGPTTGPIKPVERGELIFEDSFEFFNFDTWQHEITAGGGGNWEFQYYTNNRSNSYVRDNTLFIKPTLTSEQYGEEFLSSGVLNLWGGSPADLCTGNNWWGCERSGTPSNIINPIQSARLRSVNSFAFKYGTMEVIAQMPKGDWIWPAVWLLTKHNEYGSWPASGEIDLIESRGNRKLSSPDGIHTGCEQVGMTLHWGPYWPLNGYPLTHNTENLHSGATFGDSFHNYTMQWTSESMTFYIDGKVILNVDPGQEGFWGKGGFETGNPGIANPWINSPNKMAPFDQEMYILLNVAIGGTGYFSDADTNSPYPKPWLNTSPQAAKDFYDGKADWYPTWNPDTNNGEDAALKIKSIRVYALPEKTATSHSQQLHSNLLITLASFIATLTGIGNRRT